MIRLASRRYLHVRSVDFFQRFYRYTSSDSSPRRNELGIQMLSPKLHSQIFHEQAEQPPPEILQEIKEHLSSHGLSYQNSTELPDVSFNLPGLQGNNLDEHFRHIASEINAPYMKLINELEDLTLHRPPEKWEFKPGWTHYNPKTGKAMPVEYPRRYVLVLDVEVLTTEGSFPTLATAVSRQGWYSWCSARVTDEKEHQNTELRLKDLININRPNIEATKLPYVPPTLIVGHNVGYDRTYLKEQYFINNTSTKFLDTMSMHIAVAGLTSLQRILFVANKKDDGGMSRKEVREYSERQSQRKVIPSFRWSEETSKNNLRDVHQLYCGDEPELKKEVRDTFVKGTMDDVRRDFQELMTYCSQDVRATHSVFRELWPQFQERLPHPVTLAGMLEMGSTYLPVNKNWEKYLMSSENAANKLSDDTLSVLMKLANKAVVSKKSNWSRDLWLWDLDWKTVRVTKDKRNTAPPLKIEPSDPNVVPNAKFDIFPKWYADLNPKPKDYDQFSPGPSMISSKRRVSPKLLQLAWNNFPLHYDEKHKWGYLVPYKENVGYFGKGLVSTNGIPYPMKTFVEYCIQHNLEGQLDKNEKVSALLDSKKSIEENIQNSLDEETMVFWLRKLKQVEVSIEKEKYKAKMRSVKPRNTDTLIDVGLAGVRFIRLPHKDGPENTVGDPLSIDFLQRIESGILRSLAFNDEVNRVLKNHQMTNYWKNNKKRLRSQKVIYIPPELLPPAILESPDYRAADPEVTPLAVILPGVTTAGTITRRAVEPTWMTASNAYEDRVGSELKAMVQSPPGYCFVGADVDSQELWIASLLGDAHFAGIHGCTAFGWMNLQGTKADCTDMHSMTAKLLGIARDEAKVFNYGRIYGGGERFACQLLQQFNHSLSDTEARSRVRIMFQATKGKQRRKFASLYKPESNGDDNGALYDEDLSPTAKDDSEHFDRWHGGTESYMFNKLERIACARKPQTPVLGCSISKTLEPSRVDLDFMMSRVNWVVQSSGVDYLHLLLVCMKWLCQKYRIDARFSISIHDEVRYLVNEKDTHRLALALQISNLYTRSLFAHKLGMHDLPQSVAFFSAVDIDKCLRKEVHLDCKTPSNPKGLQEGYGIGPGEALTIYDILEITGGQLNAPEKPQTENNDEGESEKDVG